jgi:DNA-binding GntR family transcriptional regulator
MSSAPKTAQAMDRALQQLRAKVVSGELMPGEQIRQQDMAEELGVSRVPLREALNLLADQGLLLHRPNSGYFVAKRAPNELAQISRILQLLENELLGSIEWPDDECLAQLKELNAQMRIHATAADWTPLVRLNREFHLQIYSLSPYRIILDEVKRLWTLADTFIATKMSEVEARLRTVDEHDRVIESLSRRDHAICLEVMEEHRASTAAGLSPETQLRLSHPVRPVTVTLPN